MSGLSLYPGGNPIKQKKWFFSSSLLYADVTISGFPCTCRGRPGEDEVSDGEVRDGAEDAAAGRRLDNAQGLGSRQKKTKISNSSEYKVTTLLSSDSDSISNSDILNTIRKCSEMNRGYKICPHSAVGVKFFYDHPSR